MALDPTTAADPKRAVRLAQLLALAAETFGALDEAIAWMREGNYALGGRLPLDMACVPGSPRLCSPYCPAPPAQGPPPD